MADESTAGEQQFDEKGAPIIVEPAAASEDADKASQTVVEEEDVADLIVPVRSSQQHIIARQQRTIAKLRSKEDEGGGEEGTDDGEDELSPVARRALQKEIDRNLAPVMETLVGNSDEKELQDLFTQDPNAKQYEKRIRAYMKHDAYKAIPASGIYRQLAFDDAVGLGAKKKTTADKQAAHGKSAGSSRRPTMSDPADMPSPDDINNMSDKEFEDLQFKVQSGRFAQ